MVPPPQKESLIDLPPTKENARSIRLSQQWIKMALKGLIRLGWEIERQYEQSGRNKRFATLMQMLTSTLLMHEEMAHCYQVDTDEARRITARNIRRPKSVKKGTGRASGSPRNAIAPGDTEINEAYVALLSLITAPDSKLHPPLDRQSDGRSEEMQAKDRPARKKLADTASTTEPPQPIPGEEPTLESTQILRPSEALRRKLRAALHVSKAALGDSQPTAYSSSTDEEETRPFGPEDLKSFQRYQSGK